MIYEARILLAIIACSIAIFVPIAIAMIKGAKLSSANELIIELTNKYDTLLSQKKSSEVRLGQITEQLSPFLDGFNYDPKRAHFIGNPIDFIVFLDDEIVFMEVKSGESKMTKKQKDIRALINNGKVRFETMKVDGKQIKLKPQVNE